jgi:DNA-3-methyladenine glycosylase II
MSLLLQEFEKGRRWICRTDPVMRRIVADIGPVRIKLEKDRFWMLARSIISQQISVAAARSIQGRLKAQCASGRVTAQALSSMGITELRSCGISPQKARYLLDLAEKTETQVVRLNTIGRLSDEQIVEQLTQIKGIGRWTVQMFLIFSLGRPDVFPVDDLGIRTAIRRGYSLDELPDKATCCQIADLWKPYSTVASWYCWRSLESSKT